MIYIRKTLYEIWMNVIYIYFQIGIRTRNSYKVNAIEEDRNIMKMQFVFDNIVVPISMPVCYIHS
jgi:hypothetical protein